MGKIFLVSDTHFAHKNILRFLDKEGNRTRPHWDDIEAHDFDLVARWNSVITEEDKVYHLGDVYMGNSSYVDNLLSKLNGKKRLILGNHDNPRDQVLQKHFKKIMLWRKFPEYGLLLTHVPVHESVLGEGRFKGVSVRNVHGHIHHNPAPSSKHVNISVEQIDYTPVNIEKV